MLINHLTRGRQRHKTIQAMLGAAGIDPARETVVYGQTGVRATETAGVLEQLGFEKVRGYDTSWCPHAIVG